jgi:hypothetical protein
VEQGRCGEDIGQYSGTLSQPSSSAALTGKPFSAAPRTRLVYINITISNLKTITSLSRFG